MRIAAALMVMAFALCGNVALAQSLIGVLLEVSGHTTPTIVAPSSIAAPLSIQLDREATVEFVHYLPRWECRTVLAKGGSISLETSGHKTVGALVVSDLPTCPPRLHMRQGALQLRVKPVPPAPIPSRPVLLLVGTAADEIASIEVEHCEQSGCRGIGGFVIAGRRAEPRELWPAVPSRLVFRLRSSSDWYRQPVRVLPDSEAQTDRRVIVDTD